MKLVTFVRPGEDAAGLPGFALPGTGSLDLGAATTRRIVTGGELAPPAGASPHAA